MQSPSAEIASCAPFGLARTLCDTETATSGFGPDSLWLVMAWPRAGHTQLPFDNLTAMPLLAAAGMQRLLLLLRDSDSDVT